MNAGDVITFEAKKNFTYIKTQGVGGTGDTHLFKIIFDNIFTRLSTIEIKLEVDDLPF